MPNRKRAHRSRPAQPSPSIVDLDPEDVSQELGQVDAFHIETSIEAQPNAEAAEDLDRAIDSTSEADTDPFIRVHDVGDLYGVHTPPAADTELAAREDQDAFQDATLGEHFFESLEAHSAESGPEPEREVDVTDEDEPHHSTDTRDRPVADKGSGGPGGL